MFSCRLHRTTIIVEGMGIGVGVAMVSGSFPVSDHPPPYVNDDSVTAHAHIVL